MLTLISGFFSCPFFVSVRNSAAKRLRFFFISLLTVTSSGVVIESANAAMVKGLWDNDMSMINHQLQDKMLARAREAGVTWLRVNPRWVPTSPDIYLEQVAQMRQFLVKAKAYGITTVHITPYLSGVTGYNPANTVNTPTASSLINTDLYGKYITKVAQSFKQVGMKTWYTPVNEANWYAVIPRRGAPAMYRKLVRIAAEKIKAVDPEAKLFFGETAPFARSNVPGFPRGKAADPGDFVKHVFGLNRDWNMRRGVNYSRYKLPIDGFSLHTYDFVRAPDEPLADDDKWVSGNVPTAIKRFKSLEDKGLVPKGAASNVIISEFAYRVTGAEVVPDNVAGDYLRRAWNYAKAAGVKGFLWYQLQDPQNPNEEWRSGLFDSAGTPRPVWESFRTATP